MIKITQKQFEILEAIKNFHSKYFYYPTYKELSFIIGVKSLNSVFKRIDALKKKGVLSYQSGNRKYEFLNKYYVRQKR